MVEREKVLLSYGVPCSGLDGLHLMKSWGHMAVTPIKLCTPSTPSPRCSIQQQNNIMFSNNCKHTQYRTGCGTSVSMQPAVVGQVNAKNRCIQNDLLNEAGTEWNLFTKKNITHFCDKADKLISKNIHVKNDFGYPIQSSNSGKLCRYTEVIVLCPAVLESPRGPSLARPSPLSTSSAFSSSSSSLTGSSSIDGRR